MTAARAILVAVTQVPNPERDAERHAGPQRDPTVVVVGGAMASHAGHDARGHPERPGRMDAAIAGLTDLHLGDALVTVAATPAPFDAMERVHRSRYLAELAAYCHDGGGAIDADTYATGRSWEIARLTAGAGLVVLDDLRRRNDGVGFVLSRPPGHHALADRAMGFCLLNNIAVSAAALVAAGERVLIVDWDVHHGNGTQAMFWDDPEVFYVSLHEWPFYPGSGSAGEVGGPNALGGNLNVPLPAGATGDVVCRALDEVVAPAVERFGPTWVLVSAGFDAHRDDPLADLALSDGDFAAMARRVAAFAPARGRLALFLEGGYDLHALRSSVTASLGTLVGAPRRPVSGETSGGPGMDQVEGADRRWTEAIERGRERSDRRPD